MQDQIYQELYEYICGLEIIDTHEHLPGCEEEVEKQQDILSQYLSQYFGTDLRSAGLSMADYRFACDPSKPLMERYRRVEPYWEFCRSTGYGRCLDLTARLVYGEEEINGNTLESLNGKFRASLETKGHFRRVLKDISKIRVSILDQDPDCDREFFRSVFRIDRLVHLNDMENLLRVEREAGFTVCSFDMWLEAVGLVLENRIRSGIRILKTALAYVRPLRFERVAKGLAEEEFNRFISCRFVREWEAPRYVPGEAFQNYMMHYILGMANRAGLVCQVHTGFQEGGANHVEYSDPSLMTNLFSEYPDVSFDIFHAGYPYPREAGILAKMFPNVTVDMCWTHIISPAESVQILYDWLDLIPYNKISGFGGDLITVDCVAGHQYLARQNIAAALSRKVREGIYTQERARIIAKALLYENPGRIFRLD